MKKQIENIVSNIKDHNSVGHRLKHVFHHYGRMIESLKPLPEPEAIGIMLESDPELSEEAEGKLSQYRSSIAVVVRETQLQLEKVDISLGASVLATTLLETVAAANDAPDLLRKTLEKFEQAGVIDAGLVALPLMHTTLRHPFSDLVERGSQEFAALTHQSEFTIVIPFQAIHDYAKLATRLQTELSLSRSLSAPDLEELARKAPWLSVTSTLWFSLQGYARETFGLHRNVQAKTKAILSALLLTAATRRANLSGLPLPPFPDQNATVYVHWHPRPHHSTELETVRVTFQRSSELNQLLGLPLEVSEKSWKEEQPIRDEFFEMMLKLGVHPQAKPKSTNQVHRRLDQSVRYFLRSHEHTGEAHLAVLDQAIALEGALTDNWNRGSTRRVKRRAKLVGGPGVDDAVESLVDARNSLAHGSLQIPAADWKRWRSLYAQAVTYVFKRSKNLPDNVGEPIATMFEHQSKQVSRTQRFWRWIKDFRRVLKP